MKKLIAMLAVLALAGAAMAATTVDVKRLGVTESAGHLGANLLIEVEYSDFSTTATNTAETLTLDIAAGECFALVYAEVVTEFVGAAGTDSLTVIIGDGSDDNRFLASLEMATESTELSGKFPPSTTNGHYYEAADTVDFTFTPNAENSTSGFTAGKVRFWCFMAD